MKIAFLFSGQGAQYPGMMKDLYETFQEVHTIFDKADECLSRNISQMCFYGTQEELNLTHNTQPCVLAADIAVGKTLQAHGIVPDAVFSNLKMFFLWYKLGQMKCRGLYQLEKVQWQR